MLFMRVKDINFYKMQHALRSTCYIKYFQIFQASAVFLSIFYLKNFSVYDTKNIQQLRFLFFYKEVECVFLLLYINLGLDWFVAWLFSSLILNRAQRYIKYSPHPTKLQVTSIKPGLGCPHSPAGAFLLSY